MQDLTPMTCDPDDVDPRSFPGSIGTVSWAQSSRNACADCVYTT